MKQLISSKICQFSLVLMVGVFCGWLIFKGGHSNEHAPTNGPDNETTYTCSMHPQIRQKEPGDCPLCGMDLIPVAQKSNKGGSNPFVHAMSPEAIALANVRTQKVKSVLPEREIYLTGKVAVNEQKIAVIAANYSGRIENLFVDFTGQTVSQGKTLATIYSPELITAQKELLEAAKIKGINNELYKAAKEKLRIWKIHEGQIADIENRGVVLTEFDVYADQSGVVLRRGIVKGEYVNKGDVLFEIADLSDVWIFLDAYESDLPFLKIGQKIAITLKSIPGKEFTTSISFIDPIINPQTRTVAVRAILNNPQQILKPEMFVKGKIQASLSVTEKTIVIPQTALLWTGKRSVVYVKVPNTEFPSFEMREITLGASLGEYIIVESGLAQDEELVTNGVFAIDGAAQLSGNHSMMNRPPHTTVAVPDQFSEQLTGLVNQYFEVKNSLVLSDFNIAQSNAKELASALLRIQMELLDKNAHEVWMPHYQAIKEQVGGFISAENLDKQREYFSSISNHIIEAVDLFRLNIGTTYVAFCPMALNDKGAYWLSEFDEIKNPYFGDAMMRCGDVIRQVRPNSNIEPKIQPSQGHQH